jgi:hypothetical protein
MTSVDASLHPPSVPKIHSNVKTQKKPLMNKNT